MADRLFDFEQKNVKGHTLAKTLFNFQLQPKLLYFPSFRILMFLLLGIVCHDFIYNAHFSNIKNNNTKKNNKNNNTVIKKK